MTTVGVVTGASSGMGRACVDRLAGTVDVLFAVDLRAPEIDGTIGLACDVSDDDAVQAVADAVAEAGTFRCLVHAAGISPTMDAARRIFEVNLVGTQLLLDTFEPLVVAGSVAVPFSSSSAYALAPHMNEDLEALVADPLDGALIDRAVEAVGGDPGFAYALSKVGVIRAAARAAVRWGPNGGRVVSLAPGIIDTPMGRQELDQQPLMHDMLAHTPLGRLGEPREIAAVAAFLVSDDASFLTGVDVLVDGGEQAGA